MNTPSIIKIRAEQLAEWIATAIVDQYKQKNKEVYIATRGNEQLILTVERVEYPHGLVPHSNLIWTCESDSIVLCRDVLDSKFGQILHSTGVLEGDWGHRENLETVWCALVNRSNNPQSSQPHIIM